MGGTVSILSHCMRFRQEGLWDGTGMTLAVPGEAVEQPQLSSWLPAMRAARLGQPIPVCPGHQWMHTEQKNCPAQPSDPPESPVVIIVLFLSHQVWGVFNTSGDRNSNNLHIHYVYCLSPVPLDSPWARTHLHRAQSFFLITDHCIPSTYTGTWSLVCIYGLTGETVHLSYVFRCYFKGEPL